MCRKAWDQCILLFLAERSRPWMCFVYCSSPPSRQQADVTLPPPLPSQVEVPPLFAAAAAHSHDWWIEICVSRLREQSAVLTELHWVGLDWIGSDRVGSGRIGSDWVWTVIHSRRRRQQQHSQTSMKPHHRPLRLSRESPLALTSTRRMVDGGGDRLVFFFFLFQKIYNSNKSQ